MKKIYTAIMLIAVTLFISCNEQKARDDITEAIEKIRDKAVDVVDAVDKVTPKPQGSGTLTNTENEDAGSEDAGGDTPPPPTPTLTKPVVSATSVRVGQAVTFSKVEGHTYTLKQAVSGVTLSDVAGDTTKKQVSSTQAATDVVVVATLDGNTEESDPIDFLLYVATKVELQTEIRRAINAKGATANLNYIDTSDIKDMSRLFEDNTTFNGNISKWNTSSVTNMFAMFSGATSFNQPLDSWDVSSVTSMSAMFSGATSFNQPLDKWKVSSVNYMSSMFKDATVFNQLLNSWDVSRVTNMSAMFKGATSFNQPLNNWTVSIVINMSEMFSGATSFNQDISGWAASGGRNTGNMFSGATAMQTSNKPSWAK